MSDDFDFLFIILTIILLAFWGRVSDEREREREREREYLAA
jgi:hypothetical protein